MNIVENNEIPDIVDYDDTQETVNDDDVNEEGEANMISDT